MDFDDFTAIDDYPAIDEKKFEDQIRIYSKSFKYDEDIDFRVIERMQTSCLIDFPISATNVVTITLCKASKIDMDQIYLLSSSTFGKYLEVYCNKTDGIKYQLKHTESASNMEELWIKFEHKSRAIFLFQKSLNKMNTKKLARLTLIGVKLTLKDIVKLLHK